MTFPFLRMLAAACAIALSMTASPARAEDADRSWAVLREAEAAHDEGIKLRGSDPAASLAAFRRSVQAWERLRAAGAENGPMEFNLGNAYLETGDVGRAIAAYRRAERFMPGNADLERNLAQARGMAAEGFGGSGTVLVDSVARWWHLVPRGTRVAAGWTCWWLFWVLLAARMLHRVDAGHVRTTWRAALWSTAAGWALLGGSVVADEALARLRPVAVVIAPDVVLRKGNGEGYDRAIVETLGPGVEAQLLERRPGWLRLGLSDGRGGWVRDEQVEVP